MSIKKRLLSVVLAASMVFGTAPGGALVASAAENDSFLVFSDTSNNRYLTTVDSNAFNVIMYNNTFSGTFGDQHMGGIELSLHGSRIATNGDIHLLPTPEQWDATPAPSRGTKQYDDETNTITVPMTFNGSPDGKLGYDLVATPTEDGVQLKVVLTTDIPADLVGKARFNLEFIPSKYQSKSFQADGDDDGEYDTFGVFPLHPQDDMEDSERADLPSQAWYVQDWNEDRGDAQPLPFATGYEFSFAPEDEYYNINIESNSGELELFDGRNRGQNGWYVLSNLITSGKAGDTIVEWNIRPNVKEGWVREPVVGFSQAGYSPYQEKFAVMELDKWDNDYPTTASLVQVHADGTKEVVHTGSLTEPVNWQRFKYARYDFTDYTTAGMYVIRYGDQETEVFPIGKDVYDKSWQSALSGFLAVQMDHIEVREGYRIWHGAPHMDDASIGPLGVSWFDGMSMPGSMPASIAERGIEPGEHIPGLNVGGWFDAGDFDIQTNRNIEVLEDLIYAAEAFDNMEGHDTLTVEWDDKTGGTVEMHRPDGIPDVIQQIAHGSKQILAQYENLGGVGGTMEVRTLRQYTHLGDPSSDTDGYIYDPDLDENEIVERDGVVYSGKPDDRYLLLSGGGGSFTSNLTGNNTANFAGAAYLLKDYYPELAERCKKAVLEIWEKERSNQEPNLNTEWNTLVQLMLMTKAYGMEKEYESFKARLTGLVDQAVTPNNMSSRYNAMFIMDLMDDAYKAKVEDAVTQYAASVNYDTPYGVQWTTGSGWGGSPNIISLGQRMGIMYKFFPEVENLKLYTLRAVDYILGRHPANNTSWLTGVGTKSHQHPYNSNRGDESYIPGSILPGHITFNPDYVESLDDFSFLWFENESIINYQSQWISAGMAASLIAQAEQEPEQAETKDFYNDFMMNIKKVGDDGYLETNGFNVFMYSTTFDRTFGDQHCAGIELIQNGRRIATNGDIHLLPTPEQWDATPAPVRNSRTFDEATDTITVDMTFPEESTTGNPAVDYELIAEPEAGGVKLTVKLDKPLPEDLVGKAGFNLEFIPSAFIGKSFQADSDGDGKYDSYGVFPLVPEDDMVDMERARTGDQLWYVKDWNEDRGDAQPLPFATGKKMTFAAEDDENRIRITSDSGDLMLFDGRNRAQNGWFVLRTLIPEDATEIVWHISPDVEDDWTREPNIGHNQAGYEPALSKVATIELDPEFVGPDTASVERLNDDGTYTEVFSGKLGEASTWLRYNYRDFDFSEVTEPGMYVIDYAGTRTEPFPIAKGVYSNTWQQSLSNYLAVQMDHMKVREGYKIWHAPSHMDDALQAPANMKWFDGWSMGDTIESGYEPYEHIPGLNVGGWYDAGDFDIQTSRNLGVILDLALAYNEYGVDYDTLAVDWDARDVELHRPDGIPDIQQQVKQGVLQILGQLENVGFVFPVLEVPSLRQYTHLGDGSKDTDNKVYDSSLAEDEVDGLRSGKMDDRLAFAGTKNSRLQLSAAASLAAASKALRGFDDELADTCLDTAIAVWNEEDHTTGANDWAAAVELTIATDGEQVYKDRVLALMDSVMVIEPAGWFSPSFGSNGWMAARLIPYMDEAFAERVKAAAAEYTKYFDGTVENNPFGVSDTRGMWGGSTNVVSMGVTMSMLHKYFPDVVSSEYTFRVMDYILGKHAYNDTSWLSGVGTKSVEVAYGSNRADRYYIAGGIVPGYVNISPDFPEALDDFGFLWFESEYVIDTAAKWIVLANGASKFASDDVEYDVDFGDKISAEVINNKAEGIAGRATLEIYANDGTLATSESLQFDLPKFSRWKESFETDLSQYPLEDYSYQVSFKDETDQLLCEPFEKNYDMSKPRLTSLLIDGAPLEGFDANTFAYHLCFSEASDAAPQISATASDKLQVSIEQAEGIPGVATATVSSDTTNVTYSVYFEVTPLSDSFVDGTMDDLWTIHNEDPEQYSLVRGVGLRLPTLQGDIYSTNRNWNNAFTRPAGGDWEIVSKVFYDTNVPLATYQQIMMMVWQDEDNYVKLNCQPGGWGGGINTQISVESGGSSGASSSVGMQPDEDGTITLYYKITKNGNNYTGAFSKDGINYTTVGTVTAALSNPQIGLFATKNSNNPVIDTYCEYLTVTQLNGEEVISYEDMLKNAFDNASNVIFEDFPTAITEDIDFNAISAPHGYKISAVSSNPDVITNEGAIAGKGEADLEVTVTYGDLTVSRTIAVSVGGEAPDYGVSETSLKMKKGETGTFDVTMGSEAVKADIEVADEAVASVDLASVEEDATVTVSAQSEGETEITVTWYGEDDVVLGSKTVSVVVTDQSLPEPDYDVSTTSLKIEKGETETFDVTMGSEAVKADIEVADEEVVSVNPASVEEDAAVAVSALSEGETEITVTWYGEDDVVLGSKTISVVVTGQSLPGQDYDVSTTSLKMKKGETKTFDVTMGSEAVKADIEVADEEVASVDLANIEADEMVTVSALSEGETEITVTWYGEDDAVLGSKTISVVVTEKSKPSKPSGNGSSAKNDDDNERWDNVKDKIAGASDGDSISATLEDGKMVSAVVIDVLKGKNVNLVITVKDKEVVLNGTNLKGYNAAAVYYTADEIIAMAAPAVELPADNGKGNESVNPETGGEVAPVGQEVLTATIPVESTVPEAPKAAVPVAPEATIPMEPVVPEAPAVIEPTVPAEPETPAAQVAPAVGTETGMPIWAIVVIVLAAAAAIGGVSLIVIRKKHNN
ncbi:glycoside hydrolase family 9 protein [Ligaoa zhengdingensis]|uniref:glycoside hydrolase family 9 protein n=2 Tax=Ligaoa zhengdingensis TaxID=2763658 RepID=UPI0031B9F6FC